MTATAPEATHIGPAGFDRRQAAQGDRTTMPLKILTKPATRGGRKLTPHERRLLREAGEPTRRGIALYAVSDENRRDIADLYVLHPDGAYMHAGYPQVHAADGKAHPDW